MRNVRLFEARLLQLPVRAANFLKGRIHVDWLQSLDRKYRSGFVVGSRSVQGDYSADVL